jgi:hypothetical protein
MTLKNVPLYFHVNACVEIFQIYIILFFSSLFISPLSSENIKYIKF